MSDTQTILVPTETPQPVDGLFHYVCMCSPDVALCGTDVSNHPWKWGPDECVVCTDVAYDPCPRCGEA